MTHDELRERAAELAQRFIDASESIALECAEPEVATVGIIFAAAAIAKGAEVLLEDAVAEFIHFYMAVSMHDRPEGDA